jgi:AcrR family transcriptional regulator
MKRLKFVAPTKRGCVSQVAYDNSERSVRPSKHDLIVGAGRKLFMEAGFGETSMDAIAAEANVSKRTVYSHFENKETLFAAVMKGICEELGGPELYDDSLEERFDEPPREVLRWLAHGMLRLILSPNGLAVFRVVLAESVKKPELARLFWDTGPGAVAGLLSRYFAHLDKTGCISVKDPDRAALLFIGLVKSPYHLQLLFGLGEPPSIEQMEKTADLMVDFFLEGLERCSC